MRPSRTRLALLILCAAALGTTTWRPPATALEPSAATTPPAAHDDFADAFERLKALAGTWDEAEYGRVIEYRVTGIGSAGFGAALIEEFIGEPAMASVYHLDGPDLRMTHYCNAGNQPRMRAASWDPHEGVLEFEFVDVSNLKAPDAYHTRTLSVRFVDDDQVVLSFTGTKEGEVIATTHTLTRRSASSPATGGEQEAGAGATAGIARRDAERAFALMAQDLVGEWQGRLVEIDAPVEATFYLVGNGSALVEEIRRLDREDSRMLTVYHMADDELRLTHYCTMRNQPRLRAAALRDGGRTVEFELIDVTNLSVSGNRYTHKMLVSMPAADRASVTYVGVDEGNEGALTAELTRVRR